MKDLSDFKAEQISEERDLKSKLKKVNKKLKSLAEKEASIKTKIEALKKTDKNGNIFAPVVEKPEPSLSIFRQPYPPPHGPPTKTQSDLDQILLTNETVSKMETFTQIVKNFFQYKAGEDIDITITKLQAFNELFEPSFEKKSLRNLLVWPRRLKLYKIT